jgi:hypothetical protein
MLRPTVSLGVKSHLAPKNRFWSCCRSHSLVRAQRDTCFRFQTPSTWSIGFPYLYPSGTMWLSYIPRHRLPLSSPYATHSMEVFKTAKVKIKLILWPTVSPPFCLCVRQPSGAHDQLLNSTRLKLKLKLNYDRQSTGQSVLVSGAHLGPATNFSFSLRFSLDSCGVVICSALSDERSGL